MILNSLIYFNRISNALKTSENFNRPLPHSGDMIINRKAVIRMQSKYDKYNLMNLFENSVLE